MLEQGGQKYHYYVGFPPPLFDLEKDTEETVDLGPSPGHAAIRNRLHRALLHICDVDAVEAAAFVDQKAMIERYGGREAALKL